MRGANALPRLISSSRVRYASSVMLPAAICAFASFKMDFAVAVSTYIGDLSGVGRKDESPGALRSNR